MPKYFDVSKDTSPSVTEVRSRGRAGICLHSTEGQHSLEWLQGGSARAGKPASADFLVDREGNIYQITQHMYFAYHVGIGHWRGIDNVNGALNSLLVGIELESFHTDSPRYTDAQLIASAGLCRRLMDYHRLDVTSIVRHADIARPPGRRTDPVQFPGWIWSKEFLTVTLRSWPYEWPSIYP